MATIDDDWRIAHRRQLARTSADLPERDVEGAWNMSFIELALRPHVENERCIPVGNLRRERMRRD